MNRVVKYRVKNKEFISFIDNLCFASKNLYNYANYLIRQEFVKSGNVLSYNEIRRICTTSNPYKIMGSNVGQETLKYLDKSWKSFLIAVKDYSKNPTKYKGKPKIPKYLNKNGRYMVGLDSNKVDVKANFIFFRWKTCKFMNNHFKVNVPNNTRVVQCRFVPKGSGYNLELVYQIEVPDYSEEANRVAGIDLGVENFVTMVNNIGETPIVVKGGYLKSINQYYNKKKASLQSDLKNRYDLNWSKRLQKLTDKRFNKIEYEMHCISRKVVNWCVQHQIDTLIVGRNKGWKQENEGMQNFTYIPYEIFENMLAYKCENVGIKTYFINESYTSGTSFLDGEKPCKENYNKDRRVYRGLFVSNKGVKINADVNGAYQIINKVVPDAFAKGIEGVGLHPIQLTV